MNSPFENGWKSRFREFAEECDDDAGIAGWSPSGLEARVRKFQSLWSPEWSGGQWLDAGCGAGTYARMLAGSCAGVVGVDYTQSTLQKARSRGIDRVRYAVADVRQLPFEANSFDGALCFGVTQALSESESVVRELARVIKPGGQLWIDALNTWCVVHAFGALRRRMYGKPQHLRYEAPMRLKGLLGHCGFEGVRLHWLPIVPGKLRWAQLTMETRWATNALGFVPFAGMLLSHAFLLHARKRVG